MAHSHEHHHDHRPDHPCAHAADRAGQAAAALAQAEAACRDKAVRLTPIRREVLQTLYATHRPLGAYDIAEELAEQDRRDGEAGDGDRGKRRRLAPITIYRALDFLMEQGFVHRLASRNAFVACPHGHGAGDLVAFLICEACGGVDEIASQPVSSALHGLMARERFEPRSQMLEITGRCAHCRAA